MSPKVKKLIIFIGSAVALLAILLIILFSCGGNNNPQSDETSTSDSTASGLPTNEPTDIGTNQPTDVPTEYNGTQSSEVPTEANTNTPTNTSSNTQTSVSTQTQTITQSQTAATPTAPVPTETEPSYNDMFENVIDTIYISKENVQARRAPVVNTTTELKVLHLGESYKRNGINNEWSRIVVDDVVCYVSNLYISTEKPAETTSTETATDPIESDNKEFQPCDITYYVKTYGLNIRSTPDKSTSSNIVGWLQQTNEVKAIAKNDTWVIFIYKNRECYVGIGSLTTDLDSISVLNPPATSAATSAATEEEGPSK